MRDYVIITDSCCDLPIQYIENNNISYIPLTCRFKGKEYEDHFGQTLSYKEFYEGMREGEIPQTSQPSPDVYFKTFQNILKQNKDIIYICVSSGLSGTFNSANIGKSMALENFQNANIHIVDILTASLGQGLMVIKALELQKAGATFKEVIEFLEEQKFNLNTYITVDDLNHLKRGGRISNVAALFGIVLHIKPILTLNNEGKVIPALKVKGRKNAFNKMLRFVCEQIEEPEKQTIMISHGDSESDALKLKELILKELNVKEVIINDICPTVGSYGGPGALAIFFLGKHRQNHIVNLHK